MAGKFLSIEEAARVLGVSSDEVHRLVDRKKLFPMRDGATLKFKTDDIERFMADRADDSSQADELSLDLDGPSASPAMPAAPADDELAIGGTFDDADWVFAGSAVHAGSQTIVRGDQPAAAPPAADDDAGSALSFAAGSAGGAAKGGLASDEDLLLDSLVAGSSPAGSPALSGFDRGGTAAVEAGGMTLDLGDAVAGAAKSGIGSSAAGIALSGPLDSGLSLEDADAGVSGIDLAAASGIASSAIDVGGSLAGGSLAGGSLAGASLAGGSLAGEAFDLGDVTDEESASVVIATEETGDSSFFGAALDDSASVSLEDSAASSSSMSSLQLGEAVEPAIETTFSVWQVLALLCCVLLLFGGGLVMFDLAWSIRAPNATPLSTPLLNALSDTFGWQ